jgi:hypothetical protein
VQIYQIGTSHCEGSRWRNEAIAAARLCDCFASFHYARNDKICFYTFGMLAPNLCIMFTQQDIKLSVSFCTDAHLTPLSSRAVSFHLKQDFSRWLAIKIISMGGDEIDF